MLELWAITLALKASALEAFGEGSRAQLCANVKYPIGCLSLRFCLITRLRKCMLSGSSRRQEPCTPAMAASCDQP